MSDMNQDKNLQQNNTNDVADQKETMLEMEEVVEAQESTLNSEVQQESTMEEETKVKLGDMIKASFHNRKFTSGAYATSVSAVVIVIVFVFNLLVSQFNLKVDLSANAIFTLSDSTKAVVDALQDDITIYYLVQPGNEYDYFQTLAEKYDALSDHISLEYKDPVLYPKFANEYTDEQVMENSVIVVDEANGRSKYISYQDMLNQELNQQTYSYQTTGIDFEGKVTSAIQYVTNENLPVFYEVTGHGETQAGTSFCDLLEKQNVDLQSLATVKVESIPEDCEALIIFAPQNDYTEAEVTMIKDYLVNGGKALVLVDYMINECKNFNTLLNYYGVAPVDGLVVEGDASAMAANNPQYVVPTVNQEAEILSNYNGGDSFILSFYPIGIQPLDAVRSSISMETLLSTSDKAYSKVNPNSDTISKEDGDIDGPFNLAYNIKESYDGVDTQLILIGSSVIADDSLIGNSAYGNYNLFATLISELSGSEGQSVSIPVKYFEANGLTLTSAQQNQALYIAFIAIPVAILILGGFVIIQRRKR